MKKLQRLQKLQSLQGKFRGFFKDNYNDQYPTMKQMLSDIEKVKDTLLRTGLTFTLIGDSTKDQQLLKVIDETAMTTLSLWVDGKVSDSELEKIRVIFIKKVANPFIEKYDEVNQK
jgi:hypothetical protein